MIKFEGKLYSEALQNHARRQLSEDLSDKNFFAKVEKDGLNFKASFICEDMVSSDVNFDAYVAVSLAYKKLEKQLRKQHKMVNDKMAKTSIKYLHIEEEQAE